MKPIIYHIGLFLLFAVFACSNESNYTNLESADEEIAGSLGEQNAVVKVERKLIKDGYIEFETNNLATARQNISEAVKMYQGYISSDREFNSDGRKSVAVVVRVPTDHFDSFLSKATQGVKKLESKEINVKDVTEEFLDVEARLKTKKELEERYLDLVKQAKIVSDILEIENQMESLWSEIESIEGRLHYLENKVSYSTLTITFFESIPRQTEFGQKFKNGFKNGWQNLIWFFVSLVNIWPFLLIGTALFIGLRKYRKERK